MKSPRILFYDLEVFANTGKYWNGKKWETNIIKTIAYGGLASVAWKWQGEKKTHCLTREGKRNDKEIAKTLVNLFDEADVAIAHNGVAFDRKTSNTNIVKYGLSPPSPYKNVDTLKEARKHFKFDSNTLDDLARFLGVGRKLPHKGYDMWDECEMDDPKAWKEMARYNKHDVFLLEGVYEILLPWMETHPNLATIAEIPNACSKCLSTKLHSRGFNYSRTSKFKKFQCQDCGGWETARVREKKKKA